jgi:hypothetical protein
MFFARTPSTFLDKFLALAKDEHTEKADPSKFTAFLKESRIHCKLLALEVGCPSS